MKPGKQKRPKFWKNKNTKALKASTKRYLYTSNNHFTSTCIKRFIFQVFSGQLDIDKYTEEAIVPELNVDKKEPLKKKEPINKTEPEPSTNKQKILNKPQNTLKRSREPVIPSKDTDELPKKRRKEESESSKPVWGCSSSIDDFLRIPFNQRSFKERKNSRPFRRKLRKKKWGKRSWNKK
jgi:hypothetical protein